MSDTVDVEDAPKKGSSKISFLIAIVMAILGAGAGFYVSTSGMLSSDIVEQVPQKESNRTAPSSEVSTLAFVPLDPIIVSFSEGNNRRLLRFVGNLDVDPNSVAEIGILKPRIADILNGYLRSLDLEDLEEPGALLKIRSHLLHRVRIVAGEDRVKDLLIVEFVIN